jgi:hypothetical protein
MKRLFRPRARLTPAVSVGSADEVDAPVRIIRQGPLARGQAALRRPG